MGHHEQERAFSHATTIPERLGRLARPAFAALGFTLLAGSGCAVQDTSEFVPCTNGNQSGVAISRIEVADLAIWITQHPDEAFHSGQSIAGGEITFTDPVDTPTELACLATNPQGNVVYGAPGIPNLSLTNDGLAALRIAMNSNNDPLVAINEESAAAGPELAYA